MSSSNEANINNSWSKNLYKLDIILVRHAESYNNTLYNEIRRDLGENISDKEFVAEENKRRQADSTLSNRGFIQVNKQKEYLQNNNWNHLINNNNKHKWIIYSSPMKRCLLTSQGISEGLNISVMVDPKLYEIGGCYNEKLEGLCGINENEIKSLYNNFNCLPGMENGYFYGNLKMETNDEGDKRIYDISNKIWNYFFESIEKQQLENNDNNHLEGIILVSHGNVLSGLINCLMSQSNTSRMGLYVHENTGYSHIELYYDTIKNKKCFTLKQFNEYQHLIDNNNNLRSGNHTLNDHWIQEFLD